MAKVVHCHLEDQGLSFSEACVRVRFVQKNLLQTTKVVHDVKRQRAIEASSK